MEPGRGGLRVRISTSGAVLSAKAKECFHTFENIGPHGEVDAHVEFRPIEVEDGAGGFERIPFGIESVPSAIKRFIVPEKRGPLVGVIMREQRPEKHCFSKDEVFGDSPYCAYFVGAIEWDEGGLDVQCYRVVIKR